MSHVRRMDRDAKHALGRVAERGRGGQRRYKTSPGPACPSDDRSTGEIRATRRGPDAPVAFGHRHPAIGQGFQRAWAVQPGWRNEAGDRRACNILDQLASLLDPLSGLGSRETQEFTLARGHDASAQALRRRVMSLVPVIETVKEHLESSV